MPSNFTIIDTIILALYFAFTMGIGFLSMRKGSSVEGFTAADRSLPGWLTGLSILGSFVSSISFLALPGKAYADNWNPFVWSLSLPIATIIAVKYFVPFYRHIGSVSAYEQLEHRFGPWARIYAGACYLFTQLARIGTVTYLMAVPMNVLMGWDIYIIILITGIAVTIYTFVGGIVAVIWTEAIQTVVLIAGAIGCAMLMTFSLPEGPSQIFDMAIAADKFSLGSFSILEWGKTTFWVLLLYGLFINLQNFGIDQNYVQRYITTKSLKETKKSLWIAGMIYLPLSAVFFYIGTALYCYYTAYPDLLPTKYAEMPDYVFPYFIVSELPVGLKGLLISAIFAAAMSTTSCSLNSSATILLTDYYKRYFNKNASPESCMRFLRLGTIVWGLLGTFVALAFTQVRNALDAWWVLSGIFSGGMLGLFLLGIISKRANSFSAACAVCAGLAVITWMTFSTKFDFLPDSPFHLYMIPVFGTSAIFAVGFAISEIFFRKPKDA